MTTCEASVQRRGRTADDRDVPAADDVSLGAPDHLDDAFLLAAVRMGDREALGELFERWWPSAFAVARAHVREDDQAAECAAEGFARVIDAIDCGGGPTTHFDRYVAATVRNTSLEHLRRAARSVLVDEVDDSTPHDRPDHGSPPEPAMGDHVGAAFVRLIEPWQEVLWLTEVEGFTVAELADHWGITPNAVAARAYRAREALREGVLAERCPPLDTLPRPADLHPGSRRTPPATTP